ncbi:MAG: amylo-alpha-1,6-glucosidase [Planctomycetota bacterium]
MNKQQQALVSKAKEAALQVLLHNNHGAYRNLPRTAGWGYPEPYTRDLMICSLGVLTTQNKRLLKSLRRVLETLAKNQSELGHIPSLVHDPQDRGSSDTTPLFLMAVGIYRKVMKEDDFLEHAVQKALGWMRYQSPTDRYLVAQLPTSDWRDEQWVLGYGLFVNTIVYTYLCLFGQYERAVKVKQSMESFTVKGERQHRHVHEGLVLRYKPYYAMWSYKVYRSERFDLLGNSLVILSGIASPSRARKLVLWIEKESEALRENEDLAVDLPPNFFPYVRPNDPDWIPRNEKYNQPGEYHNGGIWPFICGFYIAALVAAKRYALAEKKLLALTELVRPARKADVEFGFNEWIRAQDGTPQGQDWQSWSAAMYFYAAESVEQKRTPFFEEIRKNSPKDD